MSLLSPVMTASMAASMTLMPAVLVCVTAAVILEVVLRWHDTPGQGECCDNGCKKKSELEFHG